MKRRKRKKKEGKKKNRKEGKERKESKQENGAKIYAKPNQRMKERIPFRRTTDLALKLVPGNGDVKYGQNMMASFPHECLRMAGTNSQTNCGRTTVALLSLIIPQKETQLRLWP